MPRLLSFLTFSLLCSLAVAGCSKKDESDSPSSGGGGGTGAGSRPILGAQTEDNKKETVKRLRQIAFALHNYHDINGQFPVGIVGPKGQLGLSWRVAVLEHLELPYGEGKSLYKEFKLNEPWDSEHNKKLIAKMPKVFEAPSALVSHGKTYYRSFAGPSAFVQTPPAGPKGPTFPNPWANQQPGTVARGRTIVSLVDGTSNTLMLAEAAEPVEWTKPEELPFPDVPGTPAKSRAPLPKLGGIFDGGFHGLMCDGSVHFFPDNKLTATDLYRLISVNDGEVNSPTVNEILFPRSKPGEVGDEDAVPVPTKPGASKGK